MTLPIVYEDSNILAINKPAGLAVHKTHANDQHETLADILVKERPYLKDVGEDPLRPGIVHRLDKETSGIMLIAKNQRAFEFLKKQFQDRTIHKHYTALVVGRPPQKHGIIDLPLGKLGTKQTVHIRGKQELVVREAVTEYETVKPFHDYTLLDVMPRTGRTHQIRVHMKAIGCPVVGDKLYAKDKSVPQGLSRMFLHAMRIEFITPQGQALSLEVDLPEDLQKVLAVLE